MSSNSFEAQAGGAITILGGGNIGQALAEGWAVSSERRPSEISITRRRPELLQHLAERGFRVGADNGEAVLRAEIVVLAVQPQQLVDLLDEIRPALEPGRHLLISVVSGVTIAEIGKRLDQPVPVVRAMPNTGIQLGESMTCLAAPDGAEGALGTACTLFDAVGQTLVIREELMTSATALCACGIAFFLRAIRAASQGGIEIGFHPEEALVMAAQTAKGAASLLLRAGNHPEAEIDRVTTPRGCTIAGLNEMEHQGFSSSMIKGILVSAEQASGLWTRARPALAPGEEVPPRRGASAS